MSPSGRSGVLFCSHQYHLFCDCWQNVLLHTASEYLGEDDLQLSAVVDIFHPTCK